MLHPDIRELTLNFMDCENFDDQCMEALLECLPLTLESISVDFSGYRELNS